MISYLKLLHHELTRVRRFYLFTLILILTAQTAGLLMYANNVNRDFENTAFRGTIVTEAEYARDYGFASLYKYTENSIWFLAPIALAAAAMGIYILVIWYRDWFGRNPFVYRLLTLPVSRMNIFWAKLSTVLLLVLGLIGFEMLTLPLQRGLLASQVSDALRADHSLADTVMHHPLLKIVAPVHFSDFLFFYGVGATAVTVIFTAVLLERSYRLKGVVWGILYFLAALGLFMLPLYLFLEAFPSFLFPHEVIGVQLVTISGIAAASCVFSSYLIKHKVMV